MSVSRCVYLDQADWAYLHAGKASEAEATLREYGQSRSTIFLVSIHHFEEGTGLNDPAGRAAYLRGFPGTAFTQISGDDLIRFEVEKLAFDRNLDQGMRVDLTRLVDLTEENIKDLTFGPQKMHPLRKMLEPLHAQRRETYNADLEALTAHDANASRQEQEAMWRAKIRGNASKMIEIYERVMKVKATPDQRAKLEAQASESNEYWSGLHSLGLCPPLDVDFDETFVRMVFINLPEEVKHDREALERILKRWNASVRLPSPLTCAAEVWRATADNPARKYEASEQLDVLHATFAYLANVFTADKRTVSALSRLKLKTNVIRTGRLQEVAEALKGVRDP